MWYYQQMSSNDPMWNRQYIGKWSPPPQGSSVQKYMQTLRGRRSYIGHRTDYNSRDNIQKDFEIMKQRLVGKSFIRKEFPSAVEPTFSIRKPIVLSRALDQFNKRMKVLSTPEPRMLDYYTRIHDSRYFENSMLLHAVGKEKLFLNKAKRRELLIDTYPNYEMAKFEKTNFLILNCAILNLKASYESNTYYEHRAREQKEKLIKKDETVALNEKHTILQVLCGGKKMWIGFCFEDLHPGNEHVVGIINDHFDPLIGWYLNHCVELLYDSWKEVR